MCENAWGEPEKGQKGGINKRTGRKKKPDPAGFANGRPRLGFSPGMI